MSFETYPRYRDLPTLPTGERHAWNVFGDNDELGTMNFLGPQQVRGALACAAEGRVVNLALPLNLPDPPLSRSRKRYVHHIARGRGSSDDSLDGFHLQCSSQWDALSHIRYREFGYYGGRQDVDVDRGALGIDVLARKGVIGRGVLVDFAGWRDAIGQPVAGDTYAPITPTDIEQTLAWSGTRVLPGDILLLRTGWLRWYLQLSDAGRQALAGKLHNEADGMDAPGLDPGVASAAWLWDHRVAAIAADNPSLEVLRVSRDKGFLHHRILVLLGMPIGEFWYLEELAAACQARGRADFLLSAAPINLPRGVGSPCNACAVL